jgi:hypothetical protein
MLVIGGAPAFAQAAACDPCPPDCAMMKEAAAHHGKDQQTQGQADSSCKATLACAAPLAPPLLAEQIAFPARAAQPVQRQFASDRWAPSRPPDRELRPPILA